MRIRLFVFSLVLAGICASSAAEKLTVPTKAPYNRNAVFHYRVPKNHDAKRNFRYRVLVMFGGRNTDGKREAGNHLGWGDWCDKNGIFLICPGFRDDNYWEPKEWSGKTLIKALETLKKDYNICTTKLLYYGYSAGST